PPRRRSRRRGHGDRAGHPPRARVADGLGPPRVRARPHRPRVGRDQRRRARALAQRPRRRGRRTPRAAAQRRAARPPGRLIAWVEPSPGREAMGEPPAGWTVAEWPEDAAAAPDRDQVEFVVPNWEIVPDLAALPALKVVQSRSAGIDWIV